MKISSLYSLTALAGCVLAEDAYLWTIDHGAAKYANIQASSISPETASSIIARRRGLLHDRELASANAGVLREVKQYGGYQAPLYATTTDPSPSKLLIRITGFTGSVSELHMLPDLWIEGATKNLAEDFKAQADGNLCEYNLQIPSRKGVDLVYSYDAEGSSCLSTRELQMQPSILALFSTVPAAENVARDLGKLMRTLNHLAVTGDLETTLLLLPPTSKLLKPKSSRRADPSEQRLDLDLTASEVASSATSTTSASSPTKTNHKLPSFVPLCYSTQESCDSTTNSCSGHGKCYKAHNGCFKCKCASTLVRTNKDGTKKHTQWGGNACQKKDISMEFVLFASFGVVLTALVAGAIGAMYTMGAQELPSVIGAGVSGPKQK